MSEWNLDEAIGADRFDAMLQEFYDALFDDLLIGFLFQPHDKAVLVASQQRWLRAHLGDRSGTWEGPTIRQSHAHLPILAGHFDRRHELLRQLLDRWDIAEHVREAWLELDESLRPLVLNLGAVERDRLIEPE